MFLLVGATNGELPMKAVRKLFSALTVRKQRHLVTVIVLLCAAVAQVPDARAQSTFCLDPATCSALVLPPISGSFSSRWTKLP